jgi:SAM-dependent methyltransferase
MEDYKTLATNPRQYDSPELDWRIGGDINSSSRVFFRDNLKKHLEDLHGKSVLDIGSGVGHLFPMLQELGALVVEGLEPSERNVEYSRSLYPNVVIHHNGLQDFTTKQPFDVAICIMVFEHIMDIKDAFYCVSKMIKSGGTFYLIFGDKDFHMVNDPPKTEVDIQEMGDGIVATRTIRRRDGGESTMYDIFRPVEFFIDNAKMAGFNLLGHVELLAVRDKRNSPTLDKPICHLLILKNI